jgi:aspartyl-tRNA synthetase
VEVLQRRREKALIAKLGIEENDIVFFYAGTWAEACNILGRVRSRSPT